MKYKLVIFDMDGTILDTLKDLQVCLNYSLEQYGFEGRTLDEVRAFLGNGIRRLVELGVPKDATSSQIDFVFEKFNEYYAVHCADYTRPYAGINDLIKRLKEQGIKTAVVSNKTDYAVQSLCTQYFEGLFDYALGAREGMRKKPYADSVNLVLKELGAATCDAVYIGDTEVDIQTAKNSGLECILVDWGFRDRDKLVLEGGKVFASNSEDLYRLIME